MNKSDLRKQMLIKRRNIFNKKELSTIIVNKIINLDIYKESSVVALYYSLKDEVDTRDLIKSQDKTLLLPKIINDKIEFIKIDNDTKYKKSSFGVMEPVRTIYNGPIDIIIVPGVAFDRKLNRLGFGKGYYDKYLSCKDIYKIGICFNEQLIDTLPTDGFDIKMDLIITEKEFIN